MTIEAPPPSVRVDDLVLDGRCSFADIEKIGLSRFADLPADWRAQRGWEPIARAA